jgi:hypothetical protein
MNLDNDGGTWVGIVMGCAGCGGTDTTYVELVGTEGYEGLSAILFMVGRGNFKQPQTSYGVIFPGDVPSP